MSPQEQEKIGQVYSEEQDRLLGYIRRRIPVPTEAEDILQDVFYQLTKGFKEIRSIENMTAWLYRVTNNKIIDRSRKKKTENFDVRSNGDPEEDGPLSMEDILPDLGETPEDKELKDMIWETIDQTLDELPEEQSEVFIMHEFEDMSFNEISEKSGIPVNTLISRKRYAVLELRNRLKYLYKQLKDK